MGELPFLGVPDLDLPVLIVGAGVGGLTLAHGLRRAGVPVAVFERDRTRTGGVAGQRAGISTAGARALRGCLPPELFDTVVVTAARDQDRFTLYTEQLARLVSLPGDHAPAGADRVKDYSVSRTTLRQVLLTGLEEVVQFDKRLVRYVDHGGRVTAHFSDGTEITGRLLVGADGVRSRVRHQYLPGAAPAGTGMVAIGGRIELTEPVRGLLPPAGRAGTSVVFDRCGQLGVLHVMEFPWLAAPMRPGDLLRRWPGRRYDDTVDHISWTVSTARSRVPSDLLECDGDRDGERLRRLDGERLRQLVHDRLIADWHPDLRALVADSDPGSTFASSIRASGPLPSWRPSRVTLLGAAAHATVPGRDGTDLALRDAALLRDMLAQVRDGRSDTVTAIGAYERRSRTFPIRESGFSPR